MGKTGKWFKSFWSAKKQPTKKPIVTNSDQNPTAPGLALAPAVVPRSATPTKDRRRWSFRRSSTTSSARNPQEPIFASVVVEKAALVVAPVDAPVEDDVAVEDAAAIKIQSVFRSFLARKALKALRGLVQLQALVRGHLVRKQATAALRCMEALVTAQARARSRRIRAVEEGKFMIITNHRHSTRRRNIQQGKVQHPDYHDMEENIKIVEMDHAEYKLNRKIYSNSINKERTDDKISTYYTSTQRQQISPTPSAITDLSPRTCSAYFDDYNFATAQTSPQCYSTTSRPDPSTQTHLFTFPRPEYNYEDTMSYDYPLHPNYMSNTQSSRAKVRSQSAPKQRPEYERQPSRGRRSSIEGRGIPKGARMQRSSSHVGSATGQSVQYPWSAVKLDKSMVSIVDSECGSNYSLLTANGNNYCKNVVSYDVS